MSSNTLVNENTRTTTTTTTSNGPIAHLDHMLNSLHDEQQQQQTVTTRLPSVTLDTFDSKSPHQPSRNHSRTSMTRTNIMDGKIVESSSENSVVYRYYTGESGPVIDEHFDKAFKQPMTFSSARSLHTRDHRTPSYGYSGMMGTSSSFWPNFMASPTPYLHPTYLPSSQNEYNDWMHHHHPYRSAYSTNTTATTSSSPSTGSGNHLHPIGSPNNTTNNNASRYHHHHSSPDMDVVTAAAIGAAAAAQMFHHEKQSHHGYTPSPHHFEYHLGGSMMANASNAFPTQSFDLMGNGSSGMSLETTSNKDSATSPPWYSNHHLFC